MVGDACRYGRAAIRREAGTLGKDTIGASLFSLSVGGGTYGTVFGIANIIEPPHFVWLSALSGVGIGAGAFLLLERWLIPKIKSNA
jgi:hypothetical protein